MDILYESYCEPSNLTAEIVVAGLAQGPRFYGVTGDAGAATTIVHLPDDATDDERALVEAAVAAHDPVKDAKDLAWTELHNACTAYVYKHYSEPQQSSLNALLTEGAIMSWPNRIGYVAGALTWIKGVINYYYSKVDAITAATTLVDVSGVSWDFPGQFDSTDPLVTIRSSQNITS